MLMIRLARRGSKKRPFYDVVLADKRSPRDGKFIDLLGYFNPIARGQEPRLHLEMDKINAKLATGAQLSDRVKRLISEYQQQATETAAAA